MSAVDQGRWKDLGSLEAVFESPTVARAVREVAPPSYKTVEAFWRAPFQGEHLTPRQKELVLLAMHAAASSLNTYAIDRHVERALVAGASKEDVVDTLVSIIAMANHALYQSVPILEEELAKAGVLPSPTPPPDAELEAAKEHFKKVRGFWQAEREPLARLIPRYFTALIGIGTETWTRGSLSRKEREFLCIGVDCTVSHFYAPGLRIHIKNAIECGATRGEILEIFQLAALLGVETYVLGSQALFPNKPDH